MSTSTPKWNGPGTGSGTRPGNGPKVLGINPWIHDFAAFNLWARPAGLLACLESLRRAGCRVALADCLEEGLAGEGRHARGLFGTGRYPRTEIPLPAPLKDIPRRFSRYGVPMDRVRDVLKGLEQPDLVMVTCVMTYWYPGALEAVDMVRGLWPGVPVALGGAYATVCREHALVHAGADLVVSGPLERPDNWDSVWSLMGERAPEIPRDAGMALFTDGYEHPAYSPILGSRGCPFSCEYCAGPVLFPGFRQRGADQVIRDFAHEYAKGVREFAFFDDALLVNQKTWLRPLLEFIGDKRLDVRLHTPNAVHVRHLDATTCALLKRAGVATLRLGLESGDFEHRHDVKLTREQWKSGVANLREAGFDPSSVGAYILFGLPGQDLHLAEESVRMVRDLGIRPHLSTYSPIPGSPMFGAACAASPHPLESEPLLQNNSIWPCVPGGFSWEGRGKWRAILRGEA